MDLLEAQKLAEGLMDKHLSNGEHYWHFEFDNAVKRFGCCHYGGRKGYYISLSRKLVVLNDKSQVLDTILHEIAHAMDYEERGTSDHGPNWRRLALSIGCNGERCYSSDEVEQPEMKYTVSCNNCDHTYGKMRKPRRYSSACGKCCKKYNNGKYTPEYKLVYTQNY
jgi:predicted SprT family Zn-dependent metalloprotease